MTSKWFRCDEDLEKVQESHQYIPASKRRRSAQGQSLLSHKAHAQRRQDLIGFDTDEEVDEISWTSSDEDELEDSRHLTSRKAPVKRKRKQVSSPSTSSHHQHRVEAADVDNLDDTIVNSEDDSLESKELHFLTDEKAQSGKLSAREALTKTESPTEILDIESEDSRSSLPSQKTCQKNFTSQEESSPSTYKISASSSSVSPSQSSGGTPRMKASDWLKSLNFKTPTKTQQNVPNTEDSAKKKKKFKRGGFAEQLSGIMNREKSSYSVWKHSVTSKNEKTSSKSLTLRVERFQTLYSLQISHCTVLSPATHPTGHQSVMFTTTLVDQLGILPGCTLEISPPWQELELKHCNQSVLLCTNFCKVIAGKPVDGTNSSPTKASKLSPEKLKWYRATWKCPCATGLVADPKSCLATKFPCVPGLHSDGNNMPDIDQDVDDTSSLHTVLATQKATQGQCQSTDSILEWVDKRHGSHDLGLVGYVQRVVRRISSDSTKSYSLLVQDNHHAVCMIHGPEVESFDQISQKEGSSYEFRGLDIQDRTNRDRDPALFSVIDRVWSTDMKSSQRRDSQESEDLINAISTAATVPPGFCYVLRENTEAGFSSKEKSSASHTRSSDEITPLSKLNKDSTGISRVSVEVQVVYMLDMKEMSVPDVTKEQDDSLSTECAVYVTDRSLVSMETNYRIIKILSRSSVVEELRSQKYVILRDVVLDRGELYCDAYSSCLTSHSRATLDTVHIPSLTVDLPVFALCRVEGLIEEVDEGSAYSWDVCDKCQSENLAYRAGTKQLVCLTCKEDVSSPITKMKLKVGIRTSSLHSPHMVTVELQQSTIEELLPEESDEEGYDVACMLGRKVGPLTCIIAKNNSRSKSKAREIHLLETRLNSTH